MADKTVEVPEEKTVNKVCVRCGEEKPLAEFNNKAKTRDGKDSRCKACMAEYARAYNKKKAAAGKPQKIKHPSNDVGKPEHPGGTHVLVLDFSRHQELFANIKETANEECRSPEMQAMYWLNKIDAQGGAKEGCHVSR